MKPLNNLTLRQLKLIITALAHEIDRIEARERTFQHTETKLRNANLRQEYIQLHKQLTIHATQIQH